MTAVRFSLEDACRAAEAWGANCGPGALAAMLGTTLDDVRPHLPWFDQKHYTNPRMMRAALDSPRADYTWKVVNLNEGFGGWNWPCRGLARVQWMGPWSKPGVPMAARYRHTHWIGCCWKVGRKPRGSFEIQTGHGGECAYHLPEAGKGHGRGACNCDVEGWFIFDINCMPVGGWVALPEWQHQVVPWLLKQCEPKADGDWYVTHIVELRADQAPTS